MTSSERLHSPSDKKMITGVLKSRVNSFELGVPVILTCVHSTVAPIPCGRWQGPCRSPYRRANCCVQSTFPLAHLACLCCRFPREPSHHGQYNPMIITANIPLGGGQRGQCYMHLVGYRLMLLVLLQPLLSSKTHTTPIEPLHNGYYR